MIAENQDNLSPPQTSTRARLMPWISLALTAAFLAVGVWYLLQKVTLAEVETAVAQARPGYVLLALAIMVATLLLKAWRWQLLLLPKHSNQTPTIPLTPLFWAMMLGQYVNLIVPFFRLGEVARIYALNRQTGAGKARTLGTLVVEKTLDVIMLVLTVVVLLPFIIVPDVVRNPFTLGAAGGGALLVLYLLAYQTTWVVGVVRRAIRPLPPAIRDRLLRLVVSGLEGLAALRQPGLSFALVLLSLVVAVLSVLLPYYLFPAFGIPLGLAEAALIHVVLSIVATPPSTPAKIGVFDGAVTLALLRFGIDNDATIISYAIVYHLVVVLPQIALGSVAATRTNWQWPRAANRLRGDSQRP